jgi:sigma-E factor negative regulatory protein RseC
MLKETGRVMAVDADALWVETIQRSSCGSCVAQKGCGQTLLTRLGVKPIYLRVLLEDRRAENYHIDDDVEIGVPDDIVVNGSLLVYLLPLLLMLVFSGSAHNIFSSEGLTILAAVLGFVMGSLVVRYHAKYYLNDSRHQAVIIDEYTPKNIMIQESININS